MTPPRTPRSSGAKPETRSGKLSTGRGKGRVQDGKPRYEEFKGKSAGKGGKPGGKPQGKSQGKPGGKMGGKPRSDQTEQKRPARPLTARRAAHRLVCAVLEDHDSLAELTGRTGPLAPMEPAERARAQRLATETLRNLDPIDAILSGFIDRMPAPPVQNVLRIATYELAMGEAAHGVVNAAVTHISAMPRHNRAKGMANAVLRRVADTAPQAWATRAPSRLPDWLREPLVMAWGDTVITACEAAHAKGAPLDLTPRDPKLAEVLSKQLDADILPTGSLRLDRAVQVSALPGFDSGQWWVQDAAAAIPAHILAAKPGEKVLDICAAPGGKTMQLAAAGADVTAIDISAARTERITENLSRTGLTALVRTTDALDWTEDGYDAILLDAPCSATGTIRRHPDLPYAQDGSGISELIDLQSRMIDHALTLLARGGRLVFCTCSLIPDEGEVQVEEAIARHPGLSTDREALTIAGVDPAWITEEGGLRLRPDFWAERGGMDGFYCAVLRKPA